MNKIAFIQGRLVDKVGDNIQAFPRNDWEKELRIASENNINFIELTIDLNRIWENPILSSIGIDHLNNKLLENNIVPLACTADYIMHNPPWISNQNKMKMISEKIIESLGKINCRYLVIPLVDHSSINKKLENEAISFLLSLEPYLLKHNVQIAIESDYEPKELKRFIDKLPPQTFGINYDIGNSASLGYIPDEEFKYYFNRIKHIHVKDRILNGTTVPLGKGSADIEGCFSLLKKYEYSGDFSMQTARDDANNHIGVMLQYIKYVENLLNN